MKYAKPAETFVEKDVDEFIITDRGKNVVEADAVEIDTFETDGTTSGSSTPSVSDSGIIHVVQPEESLESIARLYAVTVEDLAALNQIGSDSAISSGTRLKIP